MELAGTATHLRRGYGAPSMEGKAARVAASERGRERVSNLRNPAYQTFLKIFENFTPQIPEKEVKGCFRGFNIKHRLGKSV